MVTCHPRFVWYQWYEGGSDGLPSRYLCRRDVNVELDFDWQNRRGTKTTPALYKKMMMFIAADD